MRKSWIRSVLFATLLIFGSSAQAFFLPDTGQTTCYSDKGSGKQITCPSPGQPLAQDGSYLINPPSYTRRNDGTVTDNNTWLMWQQTDDGITRTWDEAENYCQNLTLDRYSDWRLPNELELSTLVNYNFVYPSIDTSFFINTKSGLYWASTVQSNAHQAVSFGSGTGPFTRCVRGGPLMRDAFRNNGNGTITDASTGLMWQQGEGGQKNWGSALGYCEGLTFAGYSDWRLPNVRELQSLIAEDHNAPVLDTYYFSDYNIDYDMGYWSSSFALSNPINKWIVHFTQNWTEYADKSSKRNVRCVRGKQGQLLDEQEMSVTPLRLDFWDVGSKKILSKTFTVTNNNKGSLVVDAITNPSAPFSITTDGCSGKTLYALESCPIMVGFTPSGVGVRKDVITIHSNDADHPAATIDLSGTISAFEGGVFLVADTNPPAYAVNEDGTVTDHNTSLVWQREDDNITRTWDDADNYCQDLTLGGHAGWRLPTEKELFNIIAFDRKNPAIDSSVFPNTHSNYWSSNPSPDFKDNYWGLSFGIGSKFDSIKTALLNVRCVYGDPLPSGIFIDNGDGTVTDLATGLLWQQGENAIGKNAIEAAALCQTLSLAGHTGWRLPNVKELESIASNKHSRPAFDIIQFPQTDQSSQYWTTTTWLYKTDFDIGYPDNYTIRFSNGYLDYYDRLYGNSYYGTSTAYRCVSEGAKVKPIAVSGDVKDATTRLPLSEVSVNIIDSSNKSFTTTTDAQGLFVVSGLTQGNFTVTYAKIGFVGQTNTGTVSSGQNASVSVELVPIPPLTLSIISPQNGSTLNASLVTVTGNVSNNALVSVNGLQAECSDGSYTVSLPLSEGPNVITATAVDIYAQTASRSINVSLITKGTISGSVTDGATGRPISGAVVKITDSLLQFHTTTSGVNGEYTLTNINQGAYSLTMTSADYGTYSFSGNLTAGQTVTVNGSVSLQPPAISSVAVANITGYSAAVAWTTDQPSSSLLEYGTTATYGSSKADAALTTSHSVTINGLLPGATYHFRVVSTNSHSLSSSSLDSTLSTLSPPTITAITVTNVTTDSATVNWTTNEPSDSVIDYGTTTTYSNSSTNPAMTTIHSVTLTGLALQTQYHFRITSKNVYAIPAITEDATFTTASPITVSISSPTEGSTIPRPDVMVRGTFANSTGNETGITVNGIVAAEYGNGFIANHVPLVEGANTITVTATDSAGYTTTVLTSVSASLAGDYLAVTANIESGIAPLETDLRIDGSFSVTTPQVSYIGPGPADLSGCTSVAACKVKLMTEGAYYFTAKATGPDGNDYQDTVTITVVSKNQLDGILKSKWNSMRTALVAGNIPGALGYFSADSTQKYNTSFTRLQDQMPAIAANMQDIEIIYVTEDIAKYRIKREQVINNQSATISYYIYFGKGRDGIWRIEQF